MLRLIITSPLTLHLMLALCVSLLLNACSTSRTTPAPVEDKKGVSSQGVWMSVGVAKISNASAPALGSENAGQPGYYTVKQGDTLIRIGLDQGQNWRDVAKWNNLDNPNNIEVGQVLRVQAPNVPLASIPSSPDSASVVVRPITSTIVQSANNPSPTSSPTQKAQRRLLFLGPPTGH